MIGRVKRRYSVESVLDKHLDHQISRGPRPSAKVMVGNALRAVLPPGVPPSWQSIDAARYVSGLPRHEATAELTMFDGRAGRVRAWFWDRHSTSYAHEWLDTGDGLHCSWEEGRWVRIDPRTLEPVPAQADLFGSTPTAGIPDTTQDGRA